MKTLILAVVAVVAALSLIDAASVSLQWNQNPEPNVAGYKVFRGTASRNYSSVLNVGNVTAITYSGLSNGTTYYFAVTAYNDQSFESRFSNEILYQAPATSPTPAPSPTLTPVPTYTISGRLNYCGGVAVQDAVLALVDNQGAFMTTSDVNGDFSFTYLPGGDYTLNATKTGRPPGTQGIDLADLIAVQRHYLNWDPLTGCQFNAGDANEDGVIDTVDAIAVQRFTLNYTIGIDQVGQYRFIPASRSYVNLHSNQTYQDFGVYCIGDVANPLVEPTP